MPDEPRFPDADVREILRASSDARIPAASSGGDGGLTLSDVESIAREAGLEASGIARTAAELVIRRSDGFGGASRVQVPRTVPGLVAELTAAGTALGKLAEVHRDALSNRLKGFEPILALGGMDSDDLARAVVDGN